MKRLSRWVVGVFGALGWLLVVVTVTPVVDWWARWLAGEWREPRGQVLVVLGGDNLGDGFLGVTSYWRSVYAVRLWRQERYERVVISGDKETTGAMKEVLRIGGVPEALIDVEAESETTRQSAVRLAAMLRNERRSKVLLTSDYHMYRAWRALQKTGLVMTPHAFPDVRKRMSQRWDRLGLVWVLGRETVGIWYYKLRRWI